MQNRFESCNSRSPGISVVWKERLVAVNKRGSKEISAIVSPFYHQKFDLLYVEEFFPQKNTLNFVKKFYIIARHSGTHLYERYLVSDIVFKIINCQGTFLRCSDQGLPPLKKNGRIPSLCPQPGFFLMSALFRHSS